MPVDVAAMLDRLDSHPAAIVVDAVDDPMVSSACAVQSLEFEVQCVAGNGSIDVIPDRAFDAAREPDRGVILYGHADSNGAWAALLKGSPVQVERGRVRVGTRELSGMDLSCLFLRPRPGSDTACVGVVSGTGLAGLRQTERVPYFLAGVAFPDCTIFDVDSLMTGADGARVAGFFGEDWSVDRGEFVWWK
jgi:hypothetical protein